MPNGRNSQGRVDAVVAVLREAGWQEHGVTRLETVRVGTSSSPVYGGIGGELRTFGGRKRWKLPGTDWHVSIGPRTVNFYICRAGQCSEFQNFKAADVEEIRAAAEARKKSAT